MRAENRVGRGRGFKGHGELKTPRHQAVDLSRVHLDFRRLDYTSFRPRNPKQAEVMEAIEDKALTFLIGPAGTGKSFLAVAAACELLKTGRMERLVIARPAVEAGDSIGYLTGDLNQKMDPYVRPILDALDRFLGPDIVKTLRMQGLIEVTSMTYLRGRSFDRTVLILDEMQNATPAQLKTALTRAGEGTKVLVTMDPAQCDLPAGTPSAADDLDRFRSRAMASVCAFAEFEVEDVVRSHLVKAVLTAYLEDK